MPPGSHRGPESTKHAAPGLRAYGGPEAWAGAPGFVGWGGTPPVSRHTAAPRHAPGLMHALRAGRPHRAALLAVALVAAAPFASRGPGPSGFRGTGLSAQEEPAPDSASLQAVDTPAADTAPPPPEQITAERSRTDEEIRQELQALFDRVDALSRITVEAEAGIVRLRGTVSEPAAADRAEELARARSGVLYVENDIRPTTSLADRLQPTWERLRELGYNALVLLPLVVVALLVVLLAVLAGRFLGRWGGPSFLRSRNPFLQALVARVIQLVAVLAGLVVALDILEATALVGAVVGTAGLAGLAVGFAFKDIVENYLAGVLLALRQPFARNDHVVVEGFEGKVVRLTPRETILMTLEGNHIRLPNALVFGSPMLNYTRNPLRRFQFDVGVGAADDLTRARDVGIRTLAEMAGVLETPAPEAVIRELGDSTVTVRFLGWVDQERADFGRVRSEAIRLVKLRLEAAGISLPSPEYLVRMLPGGDPSAPPEARPEPAAEVRVAEEQGDVSVDDSVDRQIDEDREASGEENLLQEGSS